MDDDELLRLLSNAKVFEPEVRNELYLTSQQVMTREHAYYIAQQAVDGLHGNQKVRIEANSLYMLLDWINALESEIARINNP